MALTCFNRSQNIKVNWDDDIPNIWKNKNVPTHQLVVDLVESWNIRFSSLVLEYSPTYTPNMAQMQVNIPYMEHLG